MTAINDLTKVTKEFLKLNKAAIRSVKAKDKIYLPDEAGQVDLNNLFGNSGTDNPGTDNPGDSTIPDSGVNTDPGKNLIGTVQLWSGTTSTTSDTEITLSKDLLSIGDGIQLSLQIIKTPITNGTTSATSILPVVASNEDKPQTGKYVASVPIPISILAKNLVIGQTINCAIDGIGEALSTTKVSQSPRLSIAIKDSTTLVITNHQGFALDQKSGSNNGAFYDVQITSANSFTKAKPIQQLANGAVLFEGKSSGEIALTNVSQNFSNVGDGIKIEFAPALEVVKDSSTTLYLSFHDLYPDIPNPLLLARSDLLEGKVFSWDAKAPRVLYPADKQGNVNSNVSYFYSVVIKNNKVHLQIENTSINLTYDPVKIQYYDPDTNWNDFGKTSMFITKITAYSK